MCDFISYISVAAIEFPIIVII